MENNMSPMESAAVAEIQRLSKFRQYAVFAALGLLVVSLLHPSMGVAVLRSLAWATAGVLSLIVASKARAVGANVSYFSALTYFAVAILPVLRGR